MKQCSSKRYLFQICNHNLFLADAMHRGERRRPIFPEYSALVIDESHKLLSLIKQPTYEFSAILVEFFILYVAFWENKT